jgi:hypothetical protein
MSTSQDILSSVAALKSLAGAPATPIIPAMRKTAKAVVASVAPAVPAFTPSAPAQTGGWRRPVPPAPEADDWTGQDLRNWRDRIGLRTQAEAAALMGLTTQGYMKLETGAYTVRLSYVYLARYIERWGPLPQK